jgi:tetratricopeptide (TPR) repeat protein
MAQHNTFTPQAYQNYEKFTATLDATIEDKLRDTTTLTNTRSPTFVQMAYKNVAILVLSLAAAYSTPTFAQDVADAGKTKTGTEQKGEKDEPKKDYVAEFMKQVDAVKIPEGKNAAWYNNSGNASLQKGNLAEACRYLVECLKVDPSDYSAHTNLGTVYFRRADSSTNDVERNSFVKQALKCYQQGVPLIEKANIGDQGRRDLLRMNYSSQGRAWTVLGDKVKAKDCLEKAQQYGKLSDKSAQLLKSLTDGQ